MPRQARDHFIVLLPFLVGLLMSMAGCDLARNRDADPTRTVGVTKQAEQPVIPSAQGTSTGPLMPLPLPTSTPAPPGITPTQPIPTITPTPALLQPAVLVTPGTVYTIAPGLEVSLEVELAANSTESIEAAVWTPDGDGLLYGTTSGKLFWSPLDNSNPVSLKSYGYDPGRLHFLLRNQRPMAATILLGHVGVEPKLSYMELLRFEPGKPPTIEKAPNRYFFTDIHWWRSDRASGLELTAYTNGNSRYVGGERLLTIDAEGHVVESRNIPYMSSGYVRPGGEWLAYSTDQAIWTIPFNGSSPSTGYLLNLNDGRRYQLTPSESGGVGHWSPDGNWLYVATYGANYLMSADMQEWIELPRDSSILGYPVWSADSRRLAFWGLHGGCDSPPSPGCNTYGSYLWILDLPSRTIADLSENSTFKSLGLVREALWSPNSSRLLLLTSDLPKGHSDSSRLTPAYYILSVK